MEQPLIVTSSYSTLRPFSSMLSQQKLKLKTERSGKPCKLIHIFELSKAMYTISGN